MPSSHQLLQWKVNNQIWKMLQCIDLQRKEQRMSRREKQSRASYKWNAKGSTAIIIFGCSHHSDMWKTQPDSHRKSITGKPTQHMAQDSRGMLGHGMHVPWMREREASNIESCCSNSQHTLIHFVPVLVIWQWLNRCEYYGVKPMFFWMCGV